MAVALNEGVKSDIVRRQFKNAQRRPSGCK